MKSMRGKFLSLASALVVLGCASWVCPAFADAKKEVVENKQTKAVEAKPKTIYEDSVEKAKAALKAEVAFKNMNENRLLEYCEFAGQLLRDFVPSSESCELFGEIEKTTLLLTAIAALENVGKNDLDSDNADPSSFVNAFHTRKDTLRKLLLRRGPACVGAISRIYPKDGKLLNRYLELVTIDEKTNKLVIAAGKNKEARNIFNELIYSSVVPCVLLIDWYYGFEKFKTLFEKAEKGNLTIEKKRAYVWSLHIFGDRDLPLIVKAKKHKNLKGILDNNVLEMPIFARHKTPERLLKYYADRMSIIFKPLSDLYKNSKIDRASLTFLADAGKNKGAKNTEKKTIKSPKKDIVLASIQTRPLVNRTYRIKLNNLRLIAKKPHNPPLTNH